MRGYKLHISLYENDQFLKVFLVLLVSLSIVQWCFSLPPTERKTFAVLFFWPSPIAFYVKPSCMNASNANTVFNKHLSK